MNCRAFASILSVTWVLALVAGAGAHAAVFTVGSPSGPGQPCTHGTIQSAINAADSSPGADTVRLTRSLTYQPEANSINTVQELTIEGGYATCTSGADSTNTIVSGTGGAAAPVFSISVPTGGWVRLRRLTISGGDVPGSGNGGGIRFSGNGILEIRDSLVTQNTAGNGGGIHAAGTGSDAELVIGANVVISNNTARNNGGGIVADQIEMSMLEPGSILLGNTALGSGGDGYGGGLHLRAGNRPSYAVVASGGGGFGTFLNNTARYGGGVAIGGSGDDGDSVSVASLRLFSREVANPVMVKGNFAAVAGGGLHIQSNGGSFVAQIAASAQLWDAVIEQNAAPEGAAAHLVGNDPPLNFPGFEGARLYINGSGWPAAARPCPVGSPCGRISGNVAEDINGNDTEGAILRSTVYSTIVIGDTLDGDTTLADAGVVIRDNRGGRLIDASGEYPTISLRNTLVFANQFTRQLARVTANLVGRLRVRDTTIAGNGATGSLIGTSNIQVAVDRSLLWQPGLVTLVRSGGTQTVGYTLASEVASLGGGSSAIVAAPRFTDPTRGDYSLRAASPAIDRAPTAGSSTRDSLGRPRLVDVALPINAAGARDIGALERQAVAPLILHGDFDFSDLRLWSYIAGSWDGTQNVSGAAGSGSWTFSTNGQTASRFVVGAQCVHLPGPGRYQLNGRGKGGGNTIISRDYAVLGWELRHNGSEDCGTGSPDAFGELTVGSGTNWGSAAQPALIDVSAANWTSTSSITVRLIALDGGVSIGGSVSAWFDGITLDLENSDRIFAHGFE